MYSRKSIPNSTSNRIYKGKANVHDLSSNETPTIQLFLEKELCERKYRFEVVLSKVSSET